MRGLTFGLLVLGIACSSSGGGQVDELVTAYCAQCSDFDNCERVISETLKAPCPDETRLYYECLTDNACDWEACGAEWTAREECIKAP